MRWLSTVAIALVLVASLPAVAVGGAFGADGTADPTRSGFGDGASDGTWTDAVEQPSSAMQVGSAGTTSPVLAPSNAADERWTSELVPADDGVIHRTMTLRQLPDRPGVFETEMTLDVPDAATELEVELEPDATVETTRGFRPTAEQAVYEWTGETDRPSITFTMDANETSVDQPEPDGESGSTAGDDPEYLFVETGDWGVVGVPRVSLYWSATASLETRCSVAVDGPGAAGENVVVFGHVEEYAREVRGETIRLVVLEAADPVADVGAALDALAAGSDALAVGARSPELTVAVVPADGVTWGSEGLQYGDHDAWVTDDSTLDAPQNVWLHEYAHSRQSYSSSSDGTTDETSWLIEGQADYYAALLAHGQGLLTFDEFRAFLERGQDDRYAQGVLVDPDSWDDHRTDYARGALVWAAIDYEIRRATDGERTAAAVFAALNRVDRPVTEADLLEAVAAYGGNSARAAAERYTRTGDLPQVWSRREHRRLFEGETAAFDARLAAGESIAVDGAYRSGTYDEPPTLVPNETIRFPVAVENVGEHAGPYDATLSVDGAHVDAASVTLEPGERTVVSLSWTPESTGTYALRVGDEPVTVAVAFPDEATVTDLAFEPPVVDPGESVTAIVTVANDGQLPAEKTVTFDAADGERTVTARVGPGETATAETTLTFEEEGRYEVVVDDRSATVAVGTAAALAQRVDAMPGFSAGVGLVALALVLASLAGIAGLRRDAPP